MANVNWSDPGTSGNWSSSTNWTGLVGGKSYPGQLVADTVTIGASNGAYVVTFDVRVRPLVPSPSREGTARTHETILRMTAGDTLNILGGVTLSQEGLSCCHRWCRNHFGRRRDHRSGGRPVPRGQSQPARTQTGGVLELTGAGFITTPFVFAIGTAAPTTLEFNLAGGVISPTAITINNVNQTLEIGPLGSLSIGATQNVTNGTILMAGRQLD